jgi:hypothetical protein
MESDSKRDEEQVVAKDKPEPTSVVFSKKKAKFEPVNEVLADLPAEPTVESSPESSVVPARIQETIDGAGKGWNIKVKSEADYKSVVAALKSSNEKTLTVIHKPGLGHHSIASK